MSEKDFENILRLEEYSFNAHDGMNMDDLHEFLRDHGDGFYTIIVENMFAGYILFWIEEDYGYMESIAIDRKFRGQGIAGMAIKFMTGKLAGSGIRSVKLHVRGGNTAAISLYEKHGFVRSGTDMNFYGEGTHASVYTLDIA